MAKLQDIIQWCDQTLISPEFKDYAPNGLQIEGKTEVHKILAAVTASQDAIDAAIRENADLLLVHHGYFWKGEAYPITGMRGKRIKSLIQHDISLLAYHLPSTAIQVLEIMQRLQICSNWNVLKRLTHLSVILLAILVI